MSGRGARNSAGLTIGISVPGIRRPCLVGEASTTAGSSVRSTAARHNRATAREAAPYARTVRPAQRSATSHSRSPSAWACAQR